jgi:hypothetical protein
VEIPAPLPSPPSSENSAANVASCPQRDIVLSFVVDTATVV